MKTKELMIYVHFPYCVRKCNYCDFCSFPFNKDEEQAYMDMLIREIEFYSESFSDYRVASLFIGGGTPSLMPGKHLRMLMDVIKERFNLCEGAEITMEANPGTVNSENAKIFKEAGINRISMGLQSANDASLKKLGRIHTFKEFEESFKCLRDAGFNNINVDVISAIPGETTNDYKRTLEKVLVMKPEHISAYSLIIEEGTPFYELYKDGDGLPSEDEERAMYDLTLDMLSKEGFSKYEISNYSKKGYECIHNCGYWTGKEYLGVGLSAAGMYNGKRFANTKNLAEYLEDFRNGREELMLSHEDRMEEFMFLGLRMTDGIDINDFKERFGIDIDSVYGEVLQKHRANGLLNRSGNKISFTKRGMEISNYVLADFLIN